MKSFNDILAISAERKGGINAVLDSIQPPLDDDDIAAIPDDRWLAQMTRCIFQAGFNWQVVNHMWAGFEDAFHGFNVAGCANLSDESLDRLATDKRIIRNAQKIATVPLNAQLVLSVSEEHGSFGQFIADWDNADYIGLLAYLKKHGARLGPASAMWLLRSMGKDSFILSKDVTRRLVVEGILTRPKYTSMPTSKTDMRAVQDAFNTWHEETGLTLTQMSRILAMSIES